MAVIKFLSRERDGKDLCCLICGGRDGFGKFST